MTWLLVIAIFALLGVRRIRNGSNAVVMRFGERTSRVLRPGFAWVWPFVDRLYNVSMEPLSVSLPPQSAITKDEIPIQLQASMEAKVLDPKLAAVTGKDWRVYVMSQLQDLMKERLEELEFDRLDEVFPQWVDSIRGQLDEKAGAIGVAITALQISNLSPRSRPA